MTRAEYQKKFGVAPVMPNKSELDTTPAPRIMTRAEYDAEFSPKKKPFGSETAQDFKGIGEGILEGGQRGADKINEAERALSAGEISKSEFALRKTGALAGSAASAIGESFIGGIKMLLPQGLENKLKNKVGDVAGSFIETIKDETNTAPGAVASRELIKWYSNLDEKQKANVDAVGGIAELVSEFVGVGVAKRGIKPGVRLAKEGIDVAEITIKGKLDDVVKNTKQRLDTSLTENINKELFNIENNYAKLRKANEFSTDAGAASRRRIAQTDVLANAVDTDGTLRTLQKGGAVDQYRKLTVDGVESVVRDNLVREGKTINLEQIRAALKRQIGTSGLEGADLLTAVKGVEKEISGLALRADELGNILLDKLHDAKISTTRNINFQTPPETATYRKAVARTYKDLVEEVSDLPVKKWNGELGKFYGDIEKLKNLDGRKVKGGRLGKYFAQVSGNLIGGAAGGAVGGPAGMAIGTIVGGEAAGLIKGKTLASTFGRKRGLAPEANVILDEAKATSKLPAVADLKKADVKLGAPKDIPRTKEVVKLERDIANNIKAQKKAIKAGDFTLVATLKDIYQTLVVKLKETVEKIRKAPNAKGFVNFGESIQSNKSGKRNTQYNKTKTTANTSIEPKSSTNATKGKGEIPSLIKEAKKYKSAEEFVKAQTNAYHGSYTKIDKFEDGYFGDTTANNQSEVFYFTKSEKHANEYGREAFARRNEGEYYDKYPELTGKDADGKYDTALTKKLYEDADLNKQTNPSFVDIKNPAIKDWEGESLANRWDEAYEFIDEAKMEGYDGVIFKNISDDVNEASLSPQDVVIAFKPDQIKTKSQLTDIWNKANQK